MRMIQHFKKHLHECIWNCFDEVAAANMQTEGKENSAIANEIVSIIIGCLQTQNNIQTSNLMKFVKMYISSPAKIGFH